MKKYYFIIFVSLLQCSTEAMNRKGKRRKTSYPLHEAIDTVFKARGSEASMIAFENAIDRRHIKIKRNKMTPIEMVARKNKDLDGKGIKVPAYVSTMYHKLLYCEISF